MGLKSSKEKKLPRRFSSRRKYKRHSPDGTPSCTTRVKPAEDSCGHNTCPCTKDRLSQFCADPVKPDTSSFSQVNSSEAPGLRVALPTAKDCGDCDVMQKKMTEPKTIATHNWKVSFETSNKKLSDLMTSLQPHIKSIELDREKGEGKIRVRFRDSIEFDSTNPFSNEVRMVTPSEPTTSNEPTNSVGSSARDRTQHYRQIPGATENKNSAEIKSCEKSSEKKTHNRSQLRELSYRRHGRCCANRTNGKLNRFRSSFDQRSFQEAMLLRLTELQRKSAIHAQAACKLTESSDSSDSDIGLRDGTDSECNDDEDSYIADSISYRNCSRIFEPLSNLESHDCEGKIAKVVETNITTSSLIEHRYQVHPTTLNDKELVKPPDKPISKRTNGKKKSLSKKHSHGYLRASAAIQKGETTFPNTPKASAKLGESSADIVPVRHEHIHHHYYYNFKPHT